MLKWALPNSFLKHRTNLKSTTKPYASSIMPKISHPMRTTKKPTPKEIVPCSIIKINKWEWKLDKQMDLIERINHEVSAFHKELNSRFCANGQRDSWYEQNLESRTRTWVTNGYHIHQLKLNTPKKAQMLNRAKTYISHGKKSLNEKEDDTQEREENTKARQSNPNFYTFFPCQTNL